MAPLGVRPGRTGATLAALALAGVGVAGCLYSLAGCGSEDGPGRTATVANDAPIKVVADEYSFDPETLVVKTGAGGVEATVPFRLQNDGALAHNLKVFDGETELGGTPIFQGGETRFGRVALKPGEYRMVCTVGNHEELGMTGTLEVGGEKRPPVGG
jgi:plastocyanin